MRNLGAWGALLVIFVGSFYMGKATTYHEDPNKTSSKEALRKDKRNAYTGRYALWTGDLAEYCR